MLRSFFLCCVLCIPLIFGTNTTSKVEHNTVSKSSTSTPVHSHKLKQENNNTKETLVSEGGTLLEITPSLTLPKENHTISLEDKDSSVVSSNSKVVPRKGVVFNESATSDNIKQVINVEHKEKSDEKIIKTNDTVSPATKNNFNSNSTNSNQSSTQIKSVTKVNVHKKPLLLSYEGLATMNQGSQNELHIPAIKSSSKTLVPDQMPSPTKENGPTAKVHPMSASRHPGMVMPIVITILVVPMFAVLGYMALRRGQEAWKNRHYKRMDFLLDGMYND